MKYIGTITGGYYDTYMKEDIIKAGARIIGTDTSEKEDRQEYTIEISVDDMENKLDNFWGRFIWSLSLVKE